MPPTVVVPRTDNDPPEISRELLLNKVSVPIVSLPLPWTTAYPELIKVLSVDPGKMEPDQLPGVSQLNPPAALVNALALPE